MAAKLNVSAPRSVRSKEAKQRIYNAALRIVDEYGADYVTVANICEVAGISVGNFYHHFASKEELLANFFLAAYEEFEDESEPEGTGDPLSDVVEFYCAYSRFCQEHGLEFTRNFYSPRNSALRMPEHQSAGNRFAMPSLDRTHRQLEAAKEAGLIREDVDASKLTDELCTIEKGAVFSWCVAEGSFDVVEYTRRLMTNYLGSFRAPAHDDSSEGERY